MSEKQVTYILDTNVLLHSPNALNAFKKCDIVIPLCVVEELDSQKRRQDDAGKNARNTIKTIDKIQESGNYKTKSNANVRIETFEYDMMDIVDLDPRKCDNQIINVAAKLKAQGESVILISNDAACRVKARYFGLEAQVFEKDRIKVDLDEVYSGLQELLLPGHEIDGFYREGELLHYDGEGLYENQFLLLKDECDPKHTALAKYQDSKVLPLKYSKMKPWDITPRNMEQFFFLEALMDPKIQLVSAVGAAGCGKSLLATAAGGEQVVEQKLYRRLVYYKSVIPIGPDLGALPGDESDKLRPFMASAYDTFEYLMGDNERLDELISKKLVELSALTYARGRSLPGLFMIVDECVAGNTHIATDYGKHKKNSISHLYSMYKQGKNLPLVLTYNEKNDIFEYKKIVNVKCRGEREVLEIKVGGIRIRCTANHPFLTERYGWLRADELQKGYLIKAYKGWNNSFKNYGVLTVEDIKITNQEEMVYDIEIEDNHNFIVVSSGKSSGSRASGPILHNCQNISPHEIKTIISRAAEGTKVVIIGDPWQVDHRFLDSQNNGLVYAVERFKGQKLFAHITLKKPERSALSGLAATLL